MANSITRYDSAETAAGGTKRPFAKAVRAGDFVYVSGQVPAVGGEIVSGGIVDQTDQVMKSIIEVLALADCGLEHVVKVNVWLDDPRDFTSFNGVFERYFIDKPPRPVHGASHIDGRCESRNGRDRLQARVTVAGVREP